MTRRVVTLLLLALATVSAAADQKKKKEIPLPPIAPLDLVRTLDLYAAGRFDDAVQAVARAGDDIGRNLRRHWAVTGRAWIDAEPEKRARRSLVAAALALETENLRAERGEWRVSENPLCTAACVLDWAHLQLLERGEPDRGERAWYLAAAAVAGGVRDWRYLQRPVDITRAPRVMPGLLDRALLRFPADSALRLAHAIAAASRFNIVAEGGAGPLSVLRSREDARLAADLLGSLRDDPAAGDEARMRLGYLHWTQGNNEAAHEELSAVVAGTRNPELRYVAGFLLGWTATARGDAEAAIGHLRSALESRPGSQSAAVLLSALELQRGDADTSDAIARGAVGTRDVDPWRLFLYGHHPQLPALIAALRREVGQ